MHLRYRCTVIGCESAGAAPADKLLRQRVTDRGSTLTELYGIGPSGAARLIGDIADIRRFRTAAHFASWKGTGPARCVLGRPAPPSPLPPR
ncbi:transposase [Micromonospora sp. NPDC000018]|uniref:transposase n=1 Tax=Micromonospora sp. NPDC000018 TaxID=3154239 RepID=UPI00331822A3